MLDLTKGYHQLVPDNESKEVTRQLSNSNIGIKTIANTTWFSPKLGQSNIIGVLELQIGLVQHDSNPTFDY